MLVNFSLLLWAVIQVLITGSQTKPPPTPSEDADCPSPAWFRIGNQCFRVVTKERLTWSSARDHCNAVSHCGGDLAQPNDVKILADYLNDYDYTSSYNDGYWLGGSDLTTEGDWRWVNNSIITTANGWGHREPNDDYSCQDCLTMHPGWGTDNTLKDEGCGMTRHFICERRMCTRNYKEQECPIPWFRIGNQCFLTANIIAEHQSPREGHNFTSARAYCGNQAPGGDLAQPSDIKGLFDYLVDGSTYSTWYYLGGSDITTEGDWRWINGSTINNGWRQGRPGTVSSGSLDCLAMLVTRKLSGHNVLLDRDCRLTSFVCERPIQRQMLMQLVLQNIKECGKI